MNVIKCIIPECGTQFKTTESVSSNTRFICKNHPRAEQVRAAGREYDEEKDNKDADVHFQDHQFDKDMRRAALPINTDHIPNQGSFSYIPPDPEALSGPDGE